MINQTIDGLFSSSDKADCWGVVEMKEIQSATYHGSCDADQWKIGLQPTYLWGGSK